MYLLWRKKKLPLKSRRDLYRHADRSIHSHVNDDIVVMLYHIFYFIIFPPFFSATREMSFVQAAASAGVMYALTRNCSEGVFEKCGCDNSHIGDPGRFSSPKQHYYTITTPPFFTVPSHCAFIIIPHFNLCSFCHKLTILTRARNDRINTVFWNIPYFILANINKESGLYLLLSKKRPGHSVS